MALPLGRVKSPTLSKWGKSENGWQRVTVPTHSESVAEHDRWCAAKRNGGGRLVKPISLTSNLELLYFFDRTFGILLFFDQKENTREIENSLFFVGTRD